MLTKKIIYFIEGKEMKKNIIVFFFYFIIMGILISIPITIVSKISGTETKVTIQQIEDMREMARNLMLDPTYKLPEYYTFENEDEKKDYVRIIIKTQSTFLKKLSVTFEKAPNDDVKLIEVQESYLAKQIFIFILIVILAILDAELKEECRRRKQ